MERYTSFRYDKKGNGRPKGSNTPITPVPINTKPKSNEKIPPGFAYAPLTKTNPLPIILLVLFVSPYIKKDKASPFLIDNGVDDSFYKSDMVLDILSSVHPYLGPDYQDGINFIFGLSEAKAILNSLINGTYQTSRIHSTSIEAANYQERAIGIIKSLQPYISLENQAVINDILHINDTVTELIQRLNKFRREDIKAQGSKGSSLTRIMELIDIVKILIPEQQQQYLNQICNALKVVETVELTKLLNDLGRESLSFETSSPSTNINMPDSDMQMESVDIKTADTEPGSINRELASPKIEESNDKIGNISNALKSILNPEQMQSLDVIMKMAQLLSQNSIEKESAN